MKLVISDKTGKSYQTELDKGRETVLVGKKIGESVDGGAFGAAGYTFEVTGGSDVSGFPMRKDIPGTRKLATVLTDGVGFNAEGKGQRKKKMVRGNQVGEDTAQVNLKVVTPGATALEQLFPKKEEAKK